MTKEILLSKLPQYRDEWLLINPDQTVKDIVHEVLEAHDEFAPYYDKIALCFDGKNTKEICDNLYAFLKQNIKYKEETEDWQTSALPTGILTRGYGDCKHYSGFSGGVLDALNRKGYGINWKYRFASYKPFDSSPHHVFIVVNDNGKEIWIDPTPNANNLKPIWQTDKKIKAGNMALHRNISGLEVDDEENMFVVGKANLTLTPFTGDNLNFDGTGSYANVFSPYLGLSSYRDYGGDRDLNRQQIADQLNQMIASGPMPGHTVTGDFVAWVYDQSIRSWNFYYPGGVAPGYSAANRLPATWPRLFITDDGRLNLTNETPLDDYRNAPIHLLTAWAQDLINQYDPSPYPVKPQHLKEFSQGLRGDFNTRNLFTEARGHSFLKDVGNALVDSLKFVKDGVLKIAGSIPRNAFLALVGLNAFNFAHNFQNKIDGGEWDEIAKKWKSLGGNPDKLFNTIQDGKDKPAILGSTGNTIGEPATVSTFLAAAAPIIALMLKFLDKDGKVTEVLSAAKNFVAAKYPDVDLTPLGFLDKKTGKYLDIQIDPADNENLGGGNDHLPGSGFNPLAWAKTNPIAAGGILFILWEMLAPKKMRLINK